MYSLRFRNACLNDIEEIIKLETEAWPNSCSATREMFESRISVFPQGNIVALLKDEIVGVVSVEIVNYSFKKPHPTWYEITANGFIDTTHDPKGSTIYGIDLSVAPKVRGEGLGKRLLQEIGKMAVKNNIQYGILGGRLPDYHLYAKMMTVEDYVNATADNGEILDKELRFYQAAGFKIGSTIKGYYKDPESLDYGILLVWKNPFYVRSRLFGRLIGHFMSRLFKL